MTFYFNWEVQLMEAIQSILGTAGVYIMSFFTTIGEEAVMIGVMAFLYWCYDKEMAKFIGINMVTGLVLNPMIKNVFLRRRPYFDNPGIKCLKPVNSKYDIYDIAAQGFSFPSGHSMNSGIMYGSFPAYKGREGKNFKILLAIGIGIPFLVGISRFSLGVHYPTDVLVGWTVGFAVIMIIPRLERALKSRYKMMLILWLISLIGIFYCRTNDYFTGLGIMTGLFAAIWFEERYVNFKNTKDPLKCALRLIFGLAFYFGLNTLLKMPFSPEFLSSGTMASFMVRAVRYTIVTFVILGAYPLCFDRIRLGRKSGEEG